MVEKPTRVLIVRGHQAAPWSLKTWEQLPARFDVGLLVTSQNMFDLGDVSLRRVPARSLRRFLPPGRVGDLASKGVTGDRYLGIDDELAVTDVVHAEELSYWFAADVARRKRENAYKLVLTVWETLPMLETFRNHHARKYRRETIAATDLFLAATERARQSLLLEGVPEERIEVCYPGIDLDRFRSPGRAVAPPTEHVLISPGRLVWEKGHQDVMRAVAALRGGIVGPFPLDRIRLVVVGSGPERRRLEAYARELGIGDIVEFRAVPYAEMPDLYAQASCMVLGSLSSASCQRYFGDLPHCFWEEQFGLVLAEAMAAGLAILASSSGAIPEVAGDSAEYFVPGDWLGLARLLGEGPLSRPPGERLRHSEVRAREFSTSAASERVAAAYDRVLASARV